MTMTALIAEDEKPALRHIIRLLDESSYDIEVVFTGDSISSTVSWLKKNTHPDLLFLDIQLADGISFNIFREIQLDSPVIFTTAYEEYALKAFKVNSIDYLLKPVQLDELNAALDKFAKNNHRKDLRYDAQVDELIHMLIHRYKSRFIVNAGPIIRSVETKNISYFYSLERSTFLYENTGKSYDINFSLDQLETELDPLHFFRISRKYIIHIEAIRKIIAYSSNRLKIEIRDSKEDDFIVSRNRVAEFKNWLER